MSCLRTADSPLAIRPLAACERIDGKVYAVNTAAALQALTDQTQGQFAGHQAAACTKLGEIEALAARGVDQYLGWYFSLGAAIGAGVGLVAGVGIDMVALAAEEKLTREDRWKDLLSAVTEALQSYRETLDCTAVGKVAGPGPK